MRRAVLSCCIFALAAFSSDINAKAQDYYQMVQDTKTYFDSNGNQVNDVYLGFDKYSPGTDTYTRFNADESTSLFLYREVWDPVSGGLVSNVRNYSVGSDVKTSGSTAYMYITEYENNNWLDTKLRLEYDLETGEHEINNVDTFNVINSDFSVLPANSSSGSSLVSKGSNGSIVLGSSSAITSLKIGTGANPTTIHRNGLKVGGENLIRRSSDGAVHIGENSLVLKESGGRQKMWATDANGDAIDIDIVNSSDLLINGKSVQGQIDSNAANISTNAKNISNLGTGIAASTSLTAALSALPAASTDSPFSCGVGTGGYSDKFALGVGCAAKINQRLNANIAASHVFGGSVDYGEGSLDTVAARAGFVFKFGKIDDSPKVAARKAAELRDEVAKLREENEAMRAESSMQEQINASLLARLERLEKIASGQLSLLGNRASSD